jgi:hypothetical protein
MKPSTSTVIAFALLFAAAPAATAEEKGHTQQEKLAHCAHESKGLKGDERQKFMSECLKGHDAERKHATREARHEAHPEGQQGKMKTCNDEARKKDLHGDERRAFMSACLRG